MVNSSAVQVSRRTLMRSLGVLATSGAAASLLAACGGTTSQIQAVSASVTAESATLSSSAAAGNAATTLSSATARPPTTVADTTADKKKVEVWTGYGTGRMANGLKEAIDHFNQINPDFVAVPTLVPWGDIHTKVLASTAAHTPPDVYRGWSWVIGSDAPLDALMPLDGYIKAEKNFNLDDFWAPTRYQMTYQGKIYGVGCSTSVQLLFHNSDLMKARGLDTTNLPSDLEGWEAYGRDLTVVSGGQIERVGFIPFVPGSLLDWGATFGGTFYDDSTQKVTLNQPANLEALNWFKGYVDRYGAANIQAFSKTYSGATFGRETAQGAFYTGRLALWDIACWLYNDMKEFGPTVNFGVTQLPSPKGVTGKPGSLDTNMYLLPTGARNPDGGFALANYMGSDLWETLHFEGVNDSVTPARKSLAMNPEVQKAAPWMALALDILPHALPVPSMPVVNFYTSHISQGVQQVLYKGADPKATLAQITTSVQQELDKTLKR